MLSSFLLSASVLSLLCFGSAEEYTVQSISVFPASQGCTFKVDITPADDFSYFDITYSTKGATPNNLVSHEPGSYTSQRRCYTSTAIYHPNRFARARPLGMDMLGSAKLGTGLTATIETNLVWGHMQAMVDSSQYSHLWYKSRFSHIQSADEFHSCENPRSKKWHVCPQRNNY